jgi:glycosyltransferase involved in cell wall biosynthesis
MKVVIATPLYPPEIGGPATYAHILAEALPKRGIEVEVVKFGEVRGAPKLLRHYQYYRMVMRAARGADVILALDPVSVGLPALWAARRSHAPLVVKVVGDYAWEQGRQRFGITQDLDSFVVTRNVPLAVKILRRVQNRVTRKAGVVIVPSEYLKKIVTAWGVEPEKIKVIYNGIALPAEIAAAKRDPNEFLIVSSGRPVPWKGFDAIKRVAEQQQGWRFFLAHGLPRAEALGWVKAADVFVLNSQYEGFAHALIEAMMLGTPVVATNVGGNPELIVDGVTGLLIPPRDDEALQAALTDIKRDYSAAYARARAAQERVGHFSVETMLDATTALLKSL